MPHFPSKYLINDRFCRGKSKRDSRTCVKKSPQYRNREWNFSGSWLTYLLRKMTKNTRFSTNDRTSNTKFILDHVFKWILREKVFSSKILRNQERCRRSRKRWFLYWGDFFYLMYGFTFSGNLRRVQRFGPILHPEITIFLDFHLKRKAKWRPERTWGNHLSPSQDPFWGHFWGPGGGLEITKSQKPQKCKYGWKVGFNGEIDDFCEIKWNFPIFCFKCHFRGPGAQRLMKPKVF